MEPLGEWFEATRGGADGAGDLYDDLAPLYDFVNRRAEDHDVIADFVTREAPAGASTVAVGGCGPGSLLARLADRYEVAVGVDVSRGMLDIAADRTDAPLVQADLRTFVAPERFDVYTLLGNDGGNPGDGGASGDGVAAVLSSVRESIAPGGVFVCDFATADDTGDGIEREDTFESDSYRVVWRRITTRDPLDGLGVGGQLTQEFTITDRGSGETVRAETSMPIRVFQPATLVGAAMAAGFTAVATVDPPTLFRGGLVAQRPT